MFTDIINDWELYSVQQEVAPEVVRQRTEEAQDMVTWMRSLDLSPREPVATEESSEAHDCEQKPTFRLASAPAVTTAAAPACVSSAEARPAAGEEADGHREPPSLHRPGGVSVLLQAVRG